MVIKWRSGITGFDSVCQNRTGFKWGWNHFDSATMFTTPPVVEELEMKFVLKAFSLIGSKLFGWSTDHGVVDTLDSCLHMTHQNS